MWGQERHRTTTYAYFRGGGTFMLVYNVENAESLANIRDKWGPQVRYHAPHAPIIIGTCSLSFWNRLPLQRCTRLT